MTKQEVFEVLKKSVKEILPEISDDEIRIERSLRELGANSIDRMEILIMMMENLKTKVPMIEFGNKKNMQELVDLFYETLNSSVAL